MLQETLITSALLPSFCTTILLPDITSKEEPAGTVASLTINTSFEPSSLSKKTEAVTPVDDLFAKVIPITIDSNADDQEPAGTV